MSKLDLGLDHVLEFYSWSPDMALADNASRYAAIAHLLPVDKYGAFVHHKKADGSSCSGSIVFDSEAARFNGREGWQVESWEPLTVSPSLLCSCGDHGYIRNGVWVPV